MRGDVLQVVKDLGPDVLVLREGGGAGVPQPRAGEVVLFTSFLTAGLAPPFSEFLKYVLSYYRIHLAHLVPNSIVILSTFAHFCEMFLGIPPNLHLFRYFFLLRPHGSDGVVGSCSFQRRGDSGLEAFIPLTLKDKWIGWTQHWSYVAADSSWESLQWPEARATWKPEWAAKEVLEARAQGALDRIRHLRDAGLTGTMVIGDFVRRRLSPLRERAHMACCYCGVDDETRTHIGGMDHPSVGAFSLSISFFFSLFFFDWEKCRSGRGAGRGKLEIMAPCFATPRRDGGPSRLCPAAWGRAPMRGRGSFRAGSEGHVLVGHNGSCQGHRPRPTTHPRDERGACIAPSSILQCWWRAGGSRPSVAWP